MMPDVISCDESNPKYRQFKQGNDILEYTLQGEEITIDWVSGRDAAKMMRVVLAADGAAVTKITGYVTDKLSNASEASLRRFAEMMIRGVSGGWSITIQRIAQRRYLMFSKECVDVDH